MAGEKPTTRLGISDARAKLTSLANEVYRGDTRVVVEKSGIPVAVLVSPRDLATLQVADQKRARLLEIIAEMEVAFADVSPEELERQAELSIQAVRAEARRKRDETNTAA